MDRFSAMQIFVKVAEVESFAEAGRILNMNPTGVTRAVAFLEETVSARLFTRTTRVVKLTEVGSRYLDDCRRILAEVAEADAAATGSYTRPSGTLTVTAAETDVCVLATILGGVDPAPGPCRSPAPCAAPATRRRAPSR